MQNRRLSKKETTQLRWATKERPTDNRRTMSCAHCSRGAFYDTAQFFSPSDELGEPDSCEAVLERRVLAKAAATVATDLKLKRFGLERVDCVPTPGSSITGSDGASCQSSIENEIPFTEHLQQWANNGPSIECPRRFVRSAMDEAHFILPAWIWKGGKPGTDTNRPIADRQWPAPTSSRRLCPRRCSDRLMSFRWPSVRPRAGSWPASCRP